MIYCYFLQLGVSTGRKGFYFVALPLFCSICRWWPKTQLFPNFKKRTTSTVKVWTWRNCSKMIRKDSRPTGRYSNCSLRWKFFLNGSKEKMRRKFLCCYIRNFLYWSSIIEFTLTERVTEMKLTFFLFVLSFSQILKTPDGEMLFDYSKNLCNDEICKLLMELVYFLLTVQFFLCVCVKEKFIFKKG